MMTRGNPIQPRGHVVPPIVRAATSALALLVGVVGLRAEPAGQIVTGDGNNTFQNIQGSQIIINNGLSPDEVRSMQKTKTSDIRMEFLGLDSVASAETLSMHDVPGFQGARLPDLVFSFTNVSQAPVHVQLDECSLVNFRYPEPIPIKTFQQSADQSVSTINGTTLMKATGTYSVVVPPGQKKAKSYAITSVDALSFDERGRGSSFCRFRIGTETIMQPVDVEISSPARYVSR